MRRLVSSVALAAVVLAGSVDRAHANPPDILGFGSRGAGMGNANSAIATDSSANYYNPAGLVRGKELTISLSYQLAQPFLKLNGRDMGVNESRGLAVSIAAPGRIGPFKFAFGVGVWLPDQRLTRTRQLAFEQPRFVYYDNRMQRFLLSANIAVQIWRGLYIGAGLNFMSRTAGGLQLKGTVDPIIPNDSALISNIQIDLLAVRYPQAGIAWEATKYLTLALVYRHRFSLSVDQRFRIDGDVGSAGSAPIVEDAYLAVRTQSLDHFHPWQLTAGAAVQITRRLLVTAELTFAAWQDFKTPASRLDISVDLKQFNDQVNLPAARSFPNPGFRNIVIPRIGAEWRGFDHHRWAVDLRGGYSYEPTPAPDQIGESNFADTDKHTMTVGFSFEIKPSMGILQHPWTFDVNLGTTFLPPRTTRKSSAVDPVGDYRINGTLMHFGVGLRSRF